MLKKILLSLVLIFSLSCEKEGYPQSIFSKSLVMDVASYSYLPYLAVDIECQNVNFGLGDGGLNFSQSLKPGSYYVYWVNAENGKKYKSQNTITIPTKVNKHFATIHVLEGNIVKLVFTDEYPEELPNNQL